MKEYGIIATSLSIRSENMHRDFGDKMSDMKLLAEHTYSTYQWPMHRVLLQEILFVEY